MNLITLAVVFFGTTMIGVIALLGTTSQWQRILLFGVLSGFFLYSGVGAAYPEVPEYYLLYYFGFLIAFVASFFFFKVVFLRLSRQAKLMLPLVFRDVDKAAVWQWVIFVYYLLLLAPLLYPRLRLIQLIKPQFIALPELLYMRFKTETETLLKLANYGKVLLTPFFYIALFRYRNRLHLVLLAILAQLYITYVVNGYISRSDILIALGTISLALWVSRPRQRSVLIICGVSLLPFMFIGSYLYSVCRIGGKVEFTGFISAATKILLIETSFPKNVVIPIIEYGARTSLIDYLRWIVTLPIPKIITGNINIAAINLEVSELILGVSRGEKGFYITLSGLVGESIYIYGLRFFWLHGIFIGFLAALIIRLLERTPQFLFLNAYVVMLFGYVLNRAGVDGALGYLINYFLLFYLIVFTVIFVIPYLSHILLRVSNNKKWEKKELG